MKKPSAFTNTNEALYQLSVQVVFLRILSESDNLTQHQRVLVHDSIQNNIAIRDLLSEENK